MAKSKQELARAQAKNIVREYLDHRDETELEEAIYEEIIEALKHNESFLALAVEFGYKQCEKGNNIQMALSEFNKTIN